ncbi:enoyl-CoA hydratase/isomerase family protein [Lachnospiraceae bacterium OttesenSCG-928-D06]|nr:enoyl-CoA hydratase/isomerase family protein [Lachnospiraceae bacterium OttesenSCG-928-D06]
MIEQRIEMENIWKEADLVYETILYEVKDKIATITLNRPETGNAFAKESYVEVRAALEKASKDEGVQVVVLTGAGKHFSAGGDIKRFKRLIESGEFLQKENVAAAGRMARAVKECDKPVIAMINGAAAGAGCALALACDFRVLEAKSKMVMSFIKMGLSGDTGGLYYLERLVGVAKATELMMLGDVLNGEQALKLSLATMVAEEGTLAETTYDLAKRLAKAPTFAIARQKRLLYETFYADIETYAEKEAEFMVECSHSADFAEAVDAFLEKRAPAFTGK